MKDTASTEVKMNGLTIGRPMLSPRSKSRIERKYESVVGLPGAGGSGSAGPEKSDSKRGMTRPLPLAKDTNKNKPKNGRHTYDPMLTEIKKRREAQLSRNNDRVQAPLQSEGEVNDHETRDILMPLQREVLLTSADITPNASASDETAKRERMSVSPLKPRVYVPCAEKSISTDQMRKRGGTVADLRESQWIDVALGSPRTPMPPVELEGVGVDVGGGDGGDGDLEVRVNRFARRGSSHHDVVAEVGQEVDVGVEGEREEAVGGKFKQRLSEMSAFTRHPGERVG